MKDYSTSNNLNLPYGFVESDTWWFEQDWDYANKPMDLVRKEFEIVPHISFYKTRPSFKQTKTLFFPFKYKDFFVKIIPKQYKQY